MVALPSATTTAVPSTADHAPVEPAAESVRERSIPYAVWQYKLDDGEFEPTSPINVVFPLDAASFEDVTDVFRAADWYPSPEDYPRYAWDGTGTEFRREDWTAAETYFGMAGRLHVRCWELDGTASAQVHLDTGATPKHGIASYARARGAVERLFADAGWTVEPERYPLRNDKPPDHDGFATLIRG